MANADLMLRFLGDSTAAERAAARTEAATRQAQATIVGAHREMAQAQEAAAQRQRAAMDTVGRGMVLAGAAIAAGVGYAISKFANFDAAMSSVAATGDDARGSLDLLRQAAIDAGASTQFSATEAAQGITELAKAGVSAADILAGGLAGSLDLAASGSIDVATAAMATATALKQFALSGDQATHVADVLAAGAGKAQGEVTDMATAFNYAAEPASALGVSLEETAGAIALFASNGLIGEQAGTALRGSLNSLTAPSQEAQEVMAELGVTMFDAQGKFVGLAGLAEQLKGALAGATDATRAQALGTIFGNAQLSAANILVDEGAAGIQKWTAAVDDQGYAAESAAIKMDNLKGDVEKLSGAFETAFIQSGSGANEFLRSLVQNITEAVDWFNNLDTGTQQAVLGIAAATAGVSLLGGGLLILIPKIAATKLALTELGVTARGSAAAFGTVSAVLAAGFAGDWLADLRAAKYTTDELAESLTKLGESGRATGALADISENFNGLISGGKDLGDVLVLADDNLNSFTGRVESFLSPGKQAQDYIADIDANLAAMVSSGNADAAAAAFDVMAAAAKAEGLSLEKVLSLFPEYNGALGDSADQHEATSAAADAVATSLGDVAEMTTTAAEAEADLDDVGRSLVDRLGATADEAARVSSEIAEFEAALSRLNDPYIDVIEAQSAWEQALDDTAAAITKMREESDAATDAVIENGAAFDLNVQAGRDMQAQLLAQRDAAAQLAQSIYEETGSEDEMRASLAMSRDSLIATAEQMGLSRDAAIALADQILQVPTVHETDFQDNSPEAIANAMKVEAGVRGIPVEWLTQAKLDPTAPVANAGAIRDAIYGIPSYRESTVRIVSIYENRYVSNDEAHFPDSRAPAAPQSRGPSSSSAPESRGPSAAERGAAAGTSSRYAGGGSSTSQMAEAFASAFKGSQQARPAEAAPMIGQLVVNNPVEETTSSAVSLGHRMTGALVGL